MVYDLTLPVPEPKKYNEKALFSQEEATPAPYTVTHERVAFANYIAEDQDAGEVTAFCDLVEWMDELRADYGPDVAIKGFRIDDDQGSTTWQAFVPTEHTIVPPEDTEDTEPTVFEKLAIRLLKDRLRHAEEALERIAKRCESLGNTDDQHVACAAFAREGLSGPFSA